VRTIVLRLTRPIRLIDIEACLETRRIVEPPMVRGASRRAWYNFAIPKGNASASVAVGRAVAVNAVFTLLGRALPFVVALVAIPIIVRQLGVERFGVLSLVWALLAQLTVFDFGFSRACTILVATAIGRSEPERIGPIARTAVHVQAILGLLGAVTVFVTSPALIALLHVHDALAAEALPTFRIAGLGLPFMIATLGLRGGLEGMQRFDVVSTIEGLSKSSLLLIPAVAAMLGTPLPTIAALMVLGQAAAFGVYLLVARAALPCFSPLWRFGAAEAVALVGFGKWIAVSSIVGPIMIYLDRWVIASLLGVASVAYYTTPSELVFRLSVISESIIGALFPALSTMYAMQRSDSAAKAANVATKVILVLVGIAAIVIIVLSRDLLTLWLGPDFASNSTAVLQILTVALIVVSVARIPYASIQAAGRPDVTAKLHLLELPIYVSLLAVCTTTLGLAGAALAWTIRVGLDAVLLFVANRRLTRPDRTVERSRSVFRGAVLVAVAAIGALAIASIVYTPLARVGSAMLLAAIATAIAHRLVLDQNERDMLRVLYLKGLERLAR
jgi:O-antigen/teichoic acid export membrane protein